MDIVAWLKDLGLERYADRFLEADIDEDVLRDLTEEDLVQLGVSLGHRKKIMRSIAQLETGRADPAQAPVSDARPDPATGAPAKPTGQSERRHITVLFCDMVGSTGLAARLDPEDMAAVYRAYNVCCVRAVERWGGRIDQFLGDGALAFFGYPQAHEDDAIRAVHAGLELVEEIGRLEIDPPIGERLRTRVGIATGLVLAGDIEHREGKGSVVGDTVNLAARLQTLAEPDQVLVGAQTRRLLGGAFATTDLGAQPLKGFSEPVPVWRIEPGGPRALSRFEARSAGAISRFRGREGEIAVLERLWADARSGEGQAVLVTGEAGIGKSRLLHEFAARLEPGTHGHHDLHCSPYHVSSALFPVIQWLERAGDIRSEDPPETRLEKLRALLGDGPPDRDTILPFIARLMSIEMPETPLPASLTPQAVKARTLSAIVSMIETSAKRRPLLLSVEDVHWLDASSKEFIDLLAERVRSLPILLVMTARPGLASEWHGRPDFTAIEVSRLDRGAAVAMIRDLAGEMRLRPNLERRLVARGDGVPLFLEELTRMTAESRALGEAGAPGGEAESALADEADTVLDPAIPDTLKDLLAARLDRLGPAKEVAQMGAVIGREFSHDLLLRAMSMEEGGIAEAIERLLESDLVFRTTRRGPVGYMFKHALVRDVAYDSLPRRRRKTLHRQLAETIERAFPGLSQAQPELVAQHYAGADMPGLALDSWHRAGMRAIERSAMVEAVDHLRHGLGQVARLADPGERDAAELKLLKGLAPALLVTKGYASEETREAFEALRSVCERMADSRELFVALRGLWAFRFVRADLAHASELAGELLELAGEDEALRLEAHRATGMTALYQGDFAAAASHLDRGAALYDRERHHAHAYRYGNDPGVVCLSYGAKAHWCLGRDRGAEARSRAALRLGEELDHPFSRNQSLALAGMLAQHREETERLLPLAEETISSANAYSFRYWFAVGSVLHAWARARQQGTRDAVEALDAGLDNYQGSGAILATPWFMALGAEARGHVGDREGALSLLAQAEARSAETGEHYYLAEILRLKGECLSRIDPEAAETALRRAIEVADRQRARPWSRRARISLARHLAATGRSREANRVVEEAMAGLDRDADADEIRRASEAVLVEPPGSSG